MLGKTNGDVEYLKDTVKHVQGWLHSGDRETDDDLQSAQWGRDCFRFLTDYCDQLRARVRELEAERDGLASQIAERDRLDCDV